MTNYNLKQKLLLLFFLLLPYVDLVTAVTTRFGLVSVSLGVIVKGAALLFSLIYVLGFSKCKYRKLTLLYLIGVAVFAALYLLTKPDVLSLPSLVTEATYAFKFLFLPLMLICLYHIFHDFDIQTNDIKRVIVVNSLVYSAMVLIPYFTKTGFATYGPDLSKGTLGWFYAGNEIGAILILLSISILYLMDNDKKWKLIFIVPVIYCATIIGTKVAYMGIIASTIIVVLAFILGTKKNRFTLPAVVLVILIVCCMNSLALWNMEKFSMEHETYYASVETEVETPVTTPTTSGKASSENTDYILNLISGNETLAKIDKILTKRLYLFLENYIPYEKAGIATKLFGLGFAPRTAIQYTYMRRLVEIDILDIWLHYGIIGFFVYFAPFLFLAYKFIGNLKKASVESYAYLLVALLGFGISCIAGHVLGAPPVSIYLILLLLVVIRQIETKKGQP
ncbi:MAG: O-antigen ligase family protein [Agathobacter sp.]|nr:O-antigen ligase family protein [Agathobacter sp.]